MDTDNRPPSARYQTATPIGQGAMGRVYRAWDPEHERFVALKYLRSNDPDWVRRLRAEAAAQARLDHPNVAPVYGVGEDQGRVYIAMAYIDGKPFDELLDELGLEGGVRILADCADAIQAAHAIGLVHRDLKPANILVSQDASGAYHPYVLDFGLVLSLDEETLTAPGEMLGTLGYMAPEQALGRRADVDRRADIYSFGCMLYQLLTGAPPLAGADRSDMLARLLNDDVPPPRNRTRRVPKALERICMQCLERDPGRRYASAAALRHDLERWLAGESVRARTTGPAWRLGRRLRRNPVMSALAASALALVLALAGWALYEQHRLELRAAQAQRTGEALKDMEWRLRGAYMTPGADIAWHKQDLRDGIDRLLAGFDRQDEIGSAQTAYVLGRAWLMLDDPAGALDWLRLDTVRSLFPDADFWAGYALALQYRNGLLGLPAIGDPDRRESQRRVIESEWRDQAVALLAETDAGADNPAFQQALLAWLQEQPEHAVELARQSRAHRPWFFEAVLLEADILQLRYVDAHRAGAYPEAGQLLADAALSLERALEIAPSAPQVLAQACDLARRADEFNALQSVQAELPETIDLEVCERLVALEPDDGAHHALLARAQSARWLWMAQTETPAPELAERAIESARSALFLSGESPEVLIDVARTIGDLGFAMRADVDQALSLLNESLRIARRVTELRPADSEAFSEAGTYARRLAAMQNMAGRDSLAAMQQSVSLLRRAVALAPERAFPRHNLAFALMSLAGHDGTEPTMVDTLLQEALEEAGAARSINPEDAVILNTLGNIHSNLGRHHLDSDGTAEVHFERALDFYTRATQLNPGYRKPHNNRANVARIMAEHLATRARDPSRWIERGRLAVEAALKIHPDYSLAWFNLGALGLIEARYLETVGLPSDASAEKALDAFAYGLELNTRILGAWLEYSEAALMLAGSDTATEAQFAKAWQAMEQARHRIGELVPEHAILVRLEHALQQRAVTGKGQASSRL